jgi:hypothetical protein
MFIDIFESETQLKKLVQSKTYSIENLETISLAAGRRGRGRQMDF